jgi:hypothetical protein
MVPFSFRQPRLKSRVMNEYISSSATVGVWALGAWGLELDVFIRPGFPAFLILISVSVFPSSPSFPSISKNRGPWCRSSAGVDHRPSRWEPNGRDGVSPSPIGPHYTPLALWPTAPFLKTQKLPNEPNLKTAPPAIPAKCEGQPD